MKTFNLSRILAIFSLMTVLTLSGCKKDGVWYEVRPYEILNYHQLSEVDKDGEYVNKKSNRGEGQVFWDGAKIKISKLGKYTKALLDENKATYKLDEWFDVEYYEYIEKKYDKTLIITFKTDVEFMPVKIAFHCI